MGALRLYTFGNFYLSPIQQGIQALHVLGELNNKYAESQTTFPSNPENPYPELAANHGAVLRDWQRNHKTVICLKGGTSVDLAATYEWIAANEPNFGFNIPFARFYEDAGLGNILTNVGAVIPEEIYDAQLGYKLDLEAVADGEDRAFVGEIHRDRNDVRNQSFYWVSPEGKIERTYAPGTADAGLIKTIKSCPLAS